MRAISPDRRAGRRRANPGVHISAAVAALVLAVAAPGTAADERIAVRVYQIQASGLSTYDCSVQVEVHNQLEVMLEGFAAVLDFFDGDGATIARKPFEMTRIRPTARRREGLGFKFALPTGRDGPRDMTELTDQCDILASVEVSLRACETRHGSIFDRCQASLDAHANSELPLLVRRDAVAEVVDYGIVALPQGHRADTADQTVIDSLGLTVSTISNDMAWQNGLSPAVQGLFIVAIASGSAAETAGLEIGDVIAEIDQDVTLTSADAMAALETALDQDRRSLLLLLDRNGTSVFAVIRLMR